MSRPTTKAALLEAMRDARVRLVGLLDEIPRERMVGEEVADGMTVKDILAHRAEWGRMTLGWYRCAAAGGEPSVPADGYRWNELPALNAEILARFRATPLDEVVAGLERVHDELRDLVESLSEEELFTPGRHRFTGTTTVAAYVNSATAAHDRSAARLIRRWWRSAG